MLVSCYKHIKKATNISCSFIAMKTSPEKREGRLFKGLFVFRQPGNQRGNKLGKKRDVARQQGHLEMEDVALLIAPVASWEATSLQTAAAKHGSSTHCNNLFVAMGVACPSPLQ